MCWWLSIICYNTCTSSTCQKWFLSVYLGSSFLVTDFCYLASCHSVSVFQSGDSWWTAGEWTDDLAQICFGTEWLSWADDASWHPACLAMPTVMHMCKGTTGCENRRSGSPHRSKSPSISPCLSLSFSIQLSWRREATWIIVSIYQGQAKVFLSLGRTRHCGKVFLRTHTPAVWLHSVCHLSPFLPRII